MNKVIMAVLSLALLEMWHVAGAAGPADATLVVHNQRSSSGALSTLVWDGSNTGGAGGMAVGAEASTATWTWDGTTLTSSGLFFTTSHISSSPMGSSVIGDRVVDLVLDTSADTTSATNYQCREGNFLATVGAHGCGNINLGSNFVFDSALAYNVGGDANCVERTTGGDDINTGNPRGLFDAAAAGVCNAVDGAFNLWTVVQDDATDGGTLVVSNGVALTSAGTNYLTFTLHATANDDGPVDVQQAGSVDIDVLANDALLVDPVDVSVTTQPTKGVAEVSGSPGAQAGIRIAYTANGGEGGADSFVYQACSSGGAPCDSATVTLNILPFGANDDSAATHLNTQVVIPVGDNDSGFGSPATVTITVPPDAGGSAVPSAPGPADDATVTFTPVAPAGTATYQETFTYEITDGVGTDTAVVTVTVENVLPDAADGDTGISTQGVAPASLTGTFLAPGPGGVLGDAPVTVDIPVQGSSGTATVAGNQITYTVTDATFFAGTDTYTYRLTDLDSEQDSATVTVTIPDVSPALADGSITTNKNAASPAFPLNVTPGNGSIAQHQLAVTTQATSGTCVLSGTTVSYTPIAGFAGNDSCVVTLTDGDGDSDAGTIGIAVVGVRSEAVDDTVFTTVDTPVVVPVLANDEGFAEWVNVLLYQVPAHGTVAIAGSPGLKSGIAVTYTPNAGFSGTDQFQYAVDDGSSADSATVTVNVVTDPDGDGIDESQDNCSAVSNPDQRDTDGDGYGNRCDADFDNNGFVNYADLAVFRQRFGTSDPDADLDGNGFVGFTDLAIFRGLFGKPPGPSGGS